jgi:hypothetical protein
MLWCLTTWLVPLDQVGGYMTGTARGLGYLKCKPATTTAAAVNTSTQAHPCAGQAEDSQEQPMFWQGHAPVPPCCGVSQHGWSPWIKWAGT